MILYWTYVELAVYPKISTHSEFEFEQSDLTEWRIWPLLAELSLDPVVSPSSQVTSGLPLATLAKL